MVMTLTGILDWHRRTYPLLEAADVYKLLHQGVFGPGHIIENPESARNYLEDEFRIQKSATGIQNWGLTEETEPIDPDGMLVRVNLGPIAREAGVVDRLVTALVESANTVKGDPEKMKRRLGAAVRWCETSLPREAQALAELAAAAGADGFQARHHSAAYLDAYQPAYRVVLSSLWPVRPDS
jgi:hypothetical protein